MNSDEFRVASREMTDYIISYLDEIRERRVVPDVSPGYLRPLLPSHAPDEGETWNDVMADIERVIMPGVTHWQSPHFHAYYPVLTSYPSILADMLSGGLGCVGFSWASSPASAELELLMMDWLGQLIGLPKQFLSSSDGKGGGVIQGSASEAVLVAVLSARSKKLSDLKNSISGNSPDVTKLVSYCSDQTHSSAERAGMMAGVITRKVKTDDSFSLCGSALRQAAAEDQEKGLTPFFVVGTIGTTPTCSFDNLREVGEVAKEFGMWFHVDAAYAGSALVCEEFRHLMEGVHLADTFNFNPHKWLLVSMDCSAMWFKDTSDTVEPFRVDPKYLKHYEEVKYPDTRHLQIPLGTRFRALKLWFVMRMYGRKGLQDHIRKQVALAHYFEALVREDPRFEIFSPVVLGLVCFRLKESNHVNECLLRTINGEGVIHMVPSEAKGTFFLRFVVASRFTELDDIAKSWQEVKRCAAKVLSMP